MVEIRWTEEAERWLRDIHDYIAANNPDAAQKVVSGIYEKAQTLSRFPEIGHKIVMRKKEKSEFFYMVITGSPISLRRNLPLIYWEYSMGLLILIGICLDIWAQQNQDSSERGRV
ncbi:MAG: type II toxin-antitoxin system RelE/ParE family toxin [Calditrichia bacterium]